MPACRRQVFCILVISYFYTLMSINNQIIKIKLTPRSKHNQILGWQGEILRVKIAAPAVDGKANVALLKFLAKEWNIGKSGLRIIKGETTRQKILEIPERISKTLQKGLF